MPVSFPMSNDTGLSPAVAQAPGDRSRAMTATTDRRPLRTVPFRAPTARLALKPVHPSGGHGGPDGAWWPRSHDLPDELSALADVLDPLGGRITHIAVNPRHWLAVPGEVFVNGHVVKVGRFTTGLDPHRVLLMSYTTGRWDLLVVPPDTHAPSAARLMGAASAGTGPPPTVTVPSAAVPA